MADDQSRPSENEHQDAESEASASRRAALASDDPERDADGDDRASEPAETADARETLDADDRPSADDALDADDAGEADETVADSGETADRKEVDEAGDDGDADEAAERAVPDDVRKYERFKKMDGAQYDRVNEFLRERTYITAREWAIARLCADFRTETGVEMTKIGENLPELVPFMTDTYTPQAVNQARSAFEGKVRQAGATFLYGAMSGFFTAEELDDMMYEVTEVAKFLLEVEGVDLSVDEELEAEDRISSVMREVQTASEQLRHDEMSCPNCGHEMEAGSDD